MTSGPQTWRMVLAKETGTTTSSLYTVANPWVAENIGELAAATDRRFSFKLNQPQTISFNLPLTDGLADDIVSLTNDALSIPIIKLYRDTTLMMVCEIVSAEITSQGQTATLAIVATETMWNRLSKRMIPDSKRALGYRVSSTVDRTKEVMTQLDHINQTPVQTIPSTIQTTFTDQAAGATPTGWALGTAFWTGTGAASSLTKQTSGSWDTDSASGFMRFTGTKDSSTTQRTISARTPTGTSGISVVPGAVYTARTTLRTTTAVTGTNNGIYVQIAWYKSDGTASAVQATTVGQPPILTTNGTTATLYDSGVAPSDAAYATVFFIVTTNVTSQSFSYGLDNVFFGPAPHTGIVSGSSAGWTSGDIFAGGPWYYKPFMEFVQEAALTAGGFDFWQTPLDPVTNNGNSGTFTVGAAATTAWTTSTSYKGQTRSNVIFEYGTGKHNVTEYRFTLSGDGLINTAYALPPGFPSGGSGTVSKADSTGTTRQRAREEVVSSDLQSDTARQQIVDAHVSVRQRYKRVFSFIPQVEDGSRTPQFGADYVIGDWVTARVQDYNNLSIDSTVRVYGADVEVDQNGFVRTTLTLVQEV
jgi:hypothetical protein